jgi:UDP-glucose 4-epimerase
MRVLVTGGAGYIGSHTVVALANAGHEPVIVDNFSNAKPAVVDRLAALLGAPPVVRRFDLTDRAATEALFAELPIDAVIHFAGLKAVGESVQRPLDYYGNNLGSTLSLLAAMQRHGVWRFVFSSSATVYGGNAPVPMREDFPTTAANPYGWSKAMIEQILSDVAATDERWRVAVLRYFNPCGAHPSGTIGEDPHGIPNNLMPFIAQVAAGRRPQLRIFGGDYPTPDGTAIRDYIHVEDLAAGHLAALNRLDGLSDRLRVWNLGTGHGSSVLEVLHAFERACGRELRHEIVERRPGDVAMSYADVSRAAAELGWRAEHGIDRICVDHWRWQSANPDGYPDEVTSTAAR